MKKIMYICLLMAASFCFAQQSMPLQNLDDCPGKLPTSPYYYCQCRNTSRVFQFPLEVQITDTMWFSATIDDMRAGLSAYWFADCSVTFEVFAFCSSKVPTVTLTVGQNQMREMSIEEINAKLEQMGDQAELLGQVLTPRIRVYPNNGGSGTAYCYPYDQGPRSTCDTMLAIVPGMTYVCDMPEEVYELTPSKISATGKGFIRWKQKKNLPGTIRLTTDSCNGPEIANVTLSDSMRVLVLDSLRMMALKNANRSVFIHVSHDSSHVGRIVYRNTIKWDRQVIDTVICQGKALQLADTALRETTYYGGDTLLLKKDTLALTGYNLTVTAAEPQYDTLYLKASQLPYSYRNNIIPKNGWGDYDFTIHQADRCDERYLLHVEHNFVTKYTNIDTTLCLGKTFKIGAVTYSRDTVIRDSVWAYAPATNTTPDTYTIRDIALHFADPEIEYDTIAVPPSQMKTNGYWYAQLGVMVRGYGDTLIVKKKNNTCTRWIQLHVDKNITIIPQDIDTTLCLGKTMMINEDAYYADTVVYDTIMIDGDEWMAGNITIRFTEPETEYDTIAVVPMMMNADGYRYEALDAMVQYGDTMIEKKAEDQCTRRIQLHVDTAAIPVTEIDTTLCLGKTISVGEITCSADTTLRDTVQIDAETWVIRDITIRFAEPEMEYDTVFVSPDQLIPAGDTLIIITEENECTRWIMRHVVLTEAIEYTTDPARETYKYLRQGVLYIRRGETDYDLFGRPINSKQ